MGCTAREGTHERVAVVHIKSAEWPAAARGWRAGSSVGEDKSSGREEGRRRVGS